MKLQDQENQSRKVQSGLRRLQKGFADIEARESKEKIEEFERMLNNLITKVEQAREKGEWRKTRLNTFETLGIQRIESTHSDILAWLLNPEEAHALGGRFLYDFFLRIFNKKPRSLASVKVFRESQEIESRPDIVVEGDGWWLIIENKIDSPEQKDQTIKYAKHWGVKGKVGEDVFFVFLTPSGIKPESKDFQPVPYRTIRELLENIPFQGEAKFLVDHFVEHIFLDLEG